MQMIFIYSEVYTTLLCKPCYWQKKPIELRNTWAWNNPGPAADDSEVLDMCASVVLSNPCLSFATRMVLWPTLRGRAVRPKIGGRCKGQADAIEGYTKLRQTCGRVFAEESKQYVVLNAPTLPTSIVTIIIHMYEYDRYGTYFVNIASIPYYCPSPLLCLLTSLHLQLSVLNNVDVFLPECHEVKLLHWTKMFSDMW